MKLTFNEGNFLLNDRGSDCWQGNNTMPKENAYASDKSETVVRNIIGGKLYDTSKATKICTICIPLKEIPSDLQPTGICGCLDEYSVDLYVGKQTFFCVFCKRVFVVSNEWTKKWLGICSVDKYIEMFGKPELA